MVRTRRARSFRPVAEGIEERVLTTGGIAASVARGAHAHVHVLTMHANAGRPKLPPLKDLPIGPGLGQGLVRLALPGNYLDYAVITLWNNTKDTQIYAVSASTYANGQFFAFTLGSGQHQSYYAPVVNGRLPVMKVAINPNFRPVVIPQMNIVFENPTYVPPGTAGRPYAINLGVNGLYLSYI